MLEDAKHQNSSPIFSSYITAPVFYLPEVSSGLEAACTPRPAQPSHTSEYGKHHLGDSQLMRFYCNLQFAGLVPWFKL